MIDGAYDGVRLNCTNQAVLTDNGPDKKSGNNLPLEIMPSEQFEPLYRTALNVQVQIANFFFAVNNTLSSLNCYFSFIFTWKEGELPVLPLSVYGAVAMALRLRGVLCPLSVLLLPLWQKKCEHIAEPRSYWQ